MTPREFTIIAGMISDKVGITYFQDSSPSWCANVSENTIQYPRKMHYSEGDLGLLIHEAAHLRFTDPLDESQFKDLCSVDEKTYKNSNQVFNLINALEDIRIERKIVEVYPGAEYYLNIMREEVIAETRYLSSYGMKNKPSLPMTYAAYMAYEAINPEFAEEMLELVGYAENKKLIEAIDKTKEAVHKVPQTESIHALMELMADDIMPYYIPLCDDDLTPKEKEELAEKFKEILKKLVRLLKQHAKEVKMEAKKKSKEKVEGETFGTIPDEATKRIKGLPEEFFKMRTGSKLTEQQLRKAIKDNFASARKAISILKDIETKRFEGNYESGKLQARKLYKVRTGTNKIFTRPVADKQDNQDMAYMIVIDESGSMNSDNKCTHAAIATGIIAEALERSGKSYGILGFNGQLHVYKSFGQKLDIPKLLQIENNPHTDYWAEWNNDGWAIKNATIMLSKRP